MKVTGPAIKNPDSIDLPSTWVTKKSRAEKRVRTFWKTLVWVILVLSILMPFNAFFTASTEVGRDYTSREMQARKGSRPTRRPTPRATPTMSAQELILAQKILLRRQLREKGMLVGECGTFRCSKRWNDYMDREIIRLIGR